jgi:hypothetical protein
MFPVGHELGFYIPEDGILHSYRLEKSQILHFCMRSADLMTCNFHMHECFLERCHELCHSPKRVSNLC